MNMWILVNPIGRCKMTSLLESYEYVDSCKPNGKL